MAKTTNNNIELKKNNLAFAAINPYVTTNTVENVEKEISGKDFIAWGSDNRYLNYLFSLYEDCATLQSIINGTSDFICGNSITCNLPIFEKTVNKNGDTINDIIQRISTDYLIFGGFALQVIRNAVGNITEIYWVDFTKIRSDKKNEVFFYSDEWDKSYGRVKYIIYPKFNEVDSNPSSIFYYKGNKTRGTYPTPIYNAAISSCELEKKINEFHLNEISNNFLTSKIINFNSGVPDDDLKNEIERNINEKFSGSENAGRILISFNPNKDSETTVTDLPMDDFAERYDALQARCREQIFLAFRAQPIIFGLQKENNGFSQDEYLQAFALYNRTVVQPIQQVIIKSFDKILGFEGSLTIVPFSIEVTKDTLIDESTVE